MLLIRLADCACGVNFANTDRSIRAEASREMYTIACPTWDQPLGVGNCRLDVLPNIALDVLPLTVTKPYVSLCTQLDGEDTISAEASFVTHYR
jgi:hypothetical protein